MARKYNKKSRNLVYQVFRDGSSDLDWIQTSNLLSRNQVRYSVAPQGLYAGANIGNFSNFTNLTSKLCQFFLNLQSAIIKLKSTI